MPDPGSFLRAPGGAPAPGLRPGVSRYRVKGGPAPAPPLPSERSSPGCDRRPGRPALAGRAMPARPGSTGFSGHGQLYFGSGFRGAAGLRLFRATCPLFSPSSNSSANRFACLCGPSSPVASSSASGWLFRHGSSSTNLSLLQSRTPPARDQSVKTRIAVLRNT